MNDNLGGKTNGCSKLALLRQNRELQKQGVDIEGAVKVYKTLISLTLFNDYVLPKFQKLNTKDFTPISPWGCEGGTNIYDAIVSAITPILKTDAMHRLHLIITDGQNGSSMHTQEEVRKLISSRIENKEHVFLLYNKDEYSNYTAKDYAAELRTDGVIPKDWAKAITAHAANPMAIKAREIKYLE